MKPVINGPKFNFGIKMPFLFKTHWAKDYYLLVIDFWKVSITLLRFSSRCLTNNSLSVYSLGLYYLTWKSRIRKSIFWSFCLWNIFVAEIIAVARKHILVSPLIDSQRDQLYYWIFYNCFSPLAVFKIDTKSS